MFDLFNKKKQEELNADVAGQMLQNIFDVCEVEPNTVPLDDLQSYSNYRKDRFFLQKVILVVVMLLFLAIPLMFLGPKIAVLEQVTQAPHPTFHLDVDSVLPVTSVKANVDGQDVPVYEKHKKVYSIEPDISGTMTVTVTCVNNQYETAQVQVSTIDRDVPKVVSDEAKDGMIYIYLKDEGSGIAWSKIYAQKSDGSTFKPAKYDANKGWIAFPYPKESINIFVPDKSENVLQLALTIK
ncbi:MAG: hypothetical protein MJ161_01940 [Clostridia bacterium]|nr:hypothetical protein [Clostridia bacterium]